MGKEAKVDTLDWEYIDENEAVTQLFKKSEALTDTQLKQLQMLNFNHFIIPMPKDDINLAQFLCRMGQIDVLRALVKRAPDIIQTKMIEADNYAAFKMATKNGHLDILQWLSETMPDKLQAMIVSGNYYAFREVCRYNHVNIVKWLAEKAPYKLEAMIKAENYSSLRNSSISDSLDIFKWLLQHYRSFDYIQTHMEYNSSDFKSFIPATLHTLHEEQKAALQINPNAVFDIADANRARVCFYIIKHLIKRNDRTLDDDIQFLLNIPSVKALAHKTVTVGHPNELLWVAMKTKNTQATTLLLNIEAVKTLAKQNNFYQNEVRDGGELRPFVTFHYSVALLNKALGYTNELAGHCHGLTMRWLEAFLLNDEPIFDKRIRRIYQDRDSLPQSINAVKEKIRAQKTVTMEDRELLDIAAFFESLNLYQSPRDYIDIFNVTHTYAQMDFSPISNIGGSDKIIEQGGLAAIHSEAGIYTEDEMAKYLDELATIIEEADVTTDSLGMLLHNWCHAIALVYQPKVGWKFMDINQYPSMTFVDTKQVAEKIAIGFQNTINKFPYYAFNTSIVVTKNQAEHLQALAGKLKIVKKNHLITKEIAQREEIVNLVWTAAMAGDTDTIVALAKAGTNLNKTNLNGMTPLYAAANNGNVDSVTVLVEAGADPNKANDNDTTPALIAAQNGHDKVIEVFANVGADLNKAVVSNGGTAAYVAAQNGYCKVIAALLGKANMDMPFIVTPTNLRNTVSKAEETIKSRMETFIERQLNASDKEDTISVKPYDIAWIKGYGDICKLLEKQVNYSPRLFNPLQVDVNTEANKSDEKKSGYIC